MFSSLEIIIYYLLFLRTAFRAFCVSIVSKIAVTSKVQGERRAKLA